MILARESVWRLFCPACGRPYFALRVRGRNTIRFAHQRPDGGRRLPEEKTRCVNSECGREYPAVSVEEFIDRLGAEGY